MLTNSSGQQVTGDYFLQQGIIDQSTNNASPAIKELMIPLPGDGNYNINIATRNNTNQNYSLNLYAYSADGNVLVSTLKGNIKPKQTESYPVNYQQNPSSGWFPKVCNTNELSDHDRNEWERSIVCKILQKINPPGKKNDE